MRGRAVGEMEDCEGGGGQLAMQQKQQQQPLEEAEMVPVHLQPFVHQVGGSSSLLCFDDTTLCKPFIKREHRFYKTLPVQMQAFVPQYRGVVEVSVEQDQDGCLSLIAHACRRTLEKYGLLSGPSLLPTPGQSSKTASCLADGHPSSHAFKLPLDNHQHKLQHKQKEEEEGKEYIIGAGAEGYHIHPWTEHCLQRQLAKMSKNREQSNGRHNFMLLENVVTGFKQPCVLDFKMGTTTVGPDHSEKKKRMFQERCRASTSAKLGFRICGMQVYQRDTGQYIFHDKYHGRKLTEKGVVEELTQYLHNGHRLRTELIELIVQRLQDLHAMVSCQDTFRFCASSLLVMYEGAEVAGNVPCESTSPNSPDLSAQPYQERDSDTDSTSEKSEHEDDVDDANDDDDDDESSQVLEELHHQRNMDVHGLDVASGSNSEDIARRVSGSPRPVVDIRMIDFAHSTHEDMGLGDCAHTGPDKGYILGLESLIRLFREVGLAKHSP